MLSVSRGVTGETLQDLTDNSDSPCVEIQQGEVAAAFTRIITVMLSWRAILHWLCMQCIYMYTHNYMTTTCRFLIFHFFISFISVESCATATRFPTDTC